MFLLSSYTVLICQNSRAHQTTQQGQAGPAYWTNTTVGNKKICCRFQLEAGNKSSVKYIQIAPGAIIKNEEEAEEVGK